MCQEYGSNVAGWFCLVVSHELQLRYWPMLQPSEGLTMAGRNTSKMTHSHDWKTGAGYWQKAQFLITWLSSGMLECVYDMAAGFL